MQRNRLKNYDNLPDLEEFGDEYDDLAEFGEKKREKEEKEVYCTKSWKELKKEYNIPDYAGLTKGWWSMRHVLSFNRLFNMIVGPRSLGKSTNASLYFIIYMLDNLDVNRNGWMYIRRDKDEVEESAETWFDNALGILNTYITKEEDKIKLEYQAGRYRLNGRLAGISVSLKKQQKLKSKNLSWIKWMVYDEAITMDGTGYIGGAGNMEKEYDYLMSLATSADRDVGCACCDEVVTIVLANNEGYNNPMYRGTGADKFVRAGMHRIAPKDAEWVLECPKYEDAPEAAKVRESRRMKLQREKMLERDYDIISGTKRNEFIKQVKSDMTPVANYTWNDVEFTFYSNYREAQFYCKAGHYNGRPIRSYALTLKDHKPNYFLITSPSKTDEPIAQMKAARTGGILYFENERIMEAVDTFLKFIV